MHWLLTKLALARICDFERDIKRIEIWKLLLHTFFEGAISRAFILILLLLPEVNTLEQAPWLV